MTRIIGVVLAVTVSDRLLGFASLYPTYKEIYFQEWGTCDESHYYEQEKESSPVGEGGQ